MRSILLALVFFPTLLVAQQKDAVISKADILATIDHMQQLDSDNRKQLTEAQKQNAELNVTLIDESQNITKLNTDISSLKQWGIDQQTRADKAQADLSATIKRYHFLKMLAAILAGITLLFISLRFMSLVAPPYSFGVPVAAFGIGYAAVWFIF